MFLQIMWNFFLPVLLCTLPFVFILALNEWVDGRTSWPREYHRKLGHVLSGLVIITSTYILTYHQLLVFAFILILVVALSTYLFHLASIHGVERKTIGTFLFPLAFLICLLLFAERQIELVRYGIWILTIPDALAALIGSQWGRQIPRWNKSLLGSTVFAFFSLRGHFHIHPLPYPLSTCGSSSHPHRICSPMGNRQPSLTPPWFLLALPPHLTCFEVEIDILQGFDGIPSGDVVLVVEAIGAVSC